MLKINLLTERRDAEKQYLKMQAGAVVVDHLAMHLDRTVRRRVHQNIRNKKKQVVRRKQKRNLQMSRRTGIGMSELLGRFQGQPNRDAAACNHEEKFVIARSNKFSRCTFCDSEFVDTLGGPTLSSFAFCGESLLVTGECKRAWLAALPLPQVVEAPPTTVTVEDHNHATRQKRLDHRYKRRNGGSSFRGSVQGNYGSVVSIFRTRKD